MSSFAPSFRGYPRGTSSEMVSRSRITDERHKRLGRGVYDLRSPAEKKRQNIENTLFVASMFVPVGLGYRAFRFLHYGSKFGKGARPIVFTGKGGRQQVRFYDTSRKRWISRSEYHSREGIGGVYPRSREMVRKAEARIERTLPVRMARKGQRASTLIHHGPFGYVRQRALDRVLPRSVQYIIAGGLAIDRTTEFIDNITDDDESSGSYRRYRTALAFGKHEPLSRSNREITGLNSRTLSPFPSLPKCPPGFRYHSGTKSCVPLR